MTSEEKLPAHRYTVKRKSLPCLGAVSDDESAPKLKSLRIEWKALRIT